MVHCGGFHAMQQQQPKHRFASVRSKISSFLTKENILKLCEVS
jgi:hypothetical protein